MERVTCYGAFSGLGPEAPGGAGSGGGPVLCGTAAAVVLVVGAGHVPTEDSRLRTPAAVGSADDREEHEVGIDAAWTVFETGVIRCATFGRTWRAVLAVGRPTCFGARGLVCASAVGVETAGKCKNPCTI